MSSETSAVPKPREFRAGPVIGGVLGGIVGVIIILAVVFFIHKRHLQRQKVTKELNKEAEDVERLCFSTYVDDKDIEALYPQSPTELSPALRVVRGGSIEEPLVLSDAMIVQLTSVQAPFPTAYSAHAK
ncbi:hypothetical protein H072_10044 [Dactylellina haptotyla CBS 200.50]|uniref:Uncharacterized protein n=1 Tax=Dactylellina haptotyla (strain CBS 200.50) TaxID=1284197 RepID=S8A184_DACHA|nr:hypothetical protein H072_10044 [Dactylellina haptotyla CBS 200.50]